jgi:polysaccharide export outer membrane protein
MTTSILQVGTLLIAVGLAGQAAAQTQTQPPPAPNGAGAKTAPSSPRTAVSPDYRLTPGDKLRVEVYKDAQLSQSLQIRPDGKVTLPLVGDIVANDLTPIELRDRIANSLKEYVTNPVVTVIVVEASPPTVYVMGEVSQPGAIPMRGSMTVLQALAMAGGFREFANPKAIRILRRANSTQKSVETIRFNYNDAIKGNVAPLFLQPGDMVVVP